MSIQQTVNQGLTTAMGASALAQITQEQRINRKYENISSKAFGQVLNELGGMEIKDISLEKQQKALKRIAERQEFMKQQALATKSNYTALQKLKSNIGLTADPQGQERKQANIEGLKQDIKNILLEKNPKKASEEKSINDFRYLQGLPPKGGK